VNRLTVKNGQVLLPDGSTSVCDVSILGSAIETVGDATQASEKAIDAAGCYVLPGIIDIHSHGMGLHSTSEGSLEDYARLCASFGATTLYPTLFAPPKAMAEQLIRHRSETSELAKTPQIAGFRLESPYMAITGGGTANSLHPIAPETTDMLLKAGGGLIKIWDVSPELSGAVELIRDLSSGGIVASIAHTRATIDQASAAVDAGARLVTHLFDTFAVPEMTDPGVYPAGLVDYLLVEDRVCCEIIGDGTHVHPLLVEKALRCKRDGIVFVTDSNLGAGLPPGRYTLPEDWGNVVVDGCNNGVRLVDRDMTLAGSALTPIDAFRNAVRLFGKDIATASRLCSKAPAQLMGLNKGEIAAGLDADLIVLDDELQLLCTISQGKIIHTA
jgi:N-acetylglucosamine-6-phosphate deacetylase